MKNAFIIAFIVILITSCGSRQDVYTTLVDDDQTNARLDEHEERLKRLETLIMRLDDLDAMQEDLNALNANLELLEGAVTDNVGELAALSDAIEALDAGIIVEVINPCGDANGHDEVLFALRDGGLVSYFEHGNRRFLSELAPGSYVTTDGTNCHFEVEMGQDGKLYVEEN